MIEFQPIVKDCNVVEPAQCRVIDADIGKKVKETISLDDFPIKKALDNVAKEMGIVITSTQAAARGSEGLKVNLNDYPSNMPYQQLIRVPIPVTAGNYNHMYFDHEEELLKRDYEGIDVSQLGELQ